MQLTTFGFLRCFASRAFAAVTVDPVGRVTSRRDDSHAPSSEPSLTVSLKLKASERQEHITLIYICACYDAGLMRIGRWGNVLVEMGNVAISARLGQIGMLRSSFVPLQKTMPMKAEWKPGVLREMAVVCQFLFQLHDSRGDSEGEGRGGGGLMAASAHREHRVQMCGSVTQFGFCGEMLPSLRSPSYPTLAFVAVAILA